MLFLYQPVHAAAIDIASYDRALGQVETALTDEVNRLNNDGTGVSPEPLRIARRELTPISEVRTSDGTIHVISTRALINGIDAAGRVRGATQRWHALRAIARRIAALRAGLDVQPPPVTGREDPVAALRSVLNGPSFQSTPIPPPSWLERAWDWISKKLFPTRKPRSTTSAPVNPVFVKILLAILVVAAVALLVVIIVPLIANRGARIKPASALEEEAILVEQRDGNRLLVLAEQRAAGGDYRHAFRLVYLATLIALDSGGILRFDRSKTNWEYLRALQAADRHDVADKMRPLTRIFDRVWYGFSPVGSLEYTRALAEHRSLVGTAQSAPNANKPR